MPGVVIVTDSSTCLPAELTVALPIRVLPISVYLPEGQGSGPGPELATPISEAAEHAELNGANHPFVTEYLGAIEAGDAEAAVVVTPAIEFAAMFRNAALAAELANRPCITVDARTAAGGQALVVLAGAEAAAGGAALENVVRVIEDASRRVEVVASLASLEPIRRNGPLPEEILASHPSSGARSVFRMRDGTVEPLACPGGPEETLEAIAGAVAASSAGGIERCTVFHAGEPELARRLVTLIQRVDFVSGFSMAMQVHTGPGVVGVAWIPRHVVEATQLTRSAS
ncbi:MAG TPA: DegV family protein [Acidimicrobiales bacterium]|nr:DegV family protein [Acidimicrobiales bacterium]